MRAVNDSPDENNDFEATSSSPQKVTDSGDTHYTVESIDSGAVTTAAYSTTVGFAVTQVPDEANATNSAHNAD